MYIIIILLCMHWIMFIIVHSQRMITLITLSERYNFGQASGSFYFYCALMPKIEKKNHPCDARAILREPDNLKPWTSSITSDLPLSSFHYSLQWWPSLLSHVRILGPNFVMCHQAYEKVDSMSATVAVKAKEILNQIKLIQRFWQFSSSSVL